MSAAARHLNLTQPALSSALRRLEDELNVRLVRRHSRGADLSEEGRFVLQKAYEIFHEVAEISSVVVNLSEEPIGNVRLGLPTTVAGGLIPQLVPLIRAHHPRINLHVIEAMSGSLAELLQVGKIDLAVLYDVQPMAGLKSEPLLKERLALLTHPRHPLAKKATVRLDDVAQVNLVLPSAVHTLRQHIDKVCRAEGVALTVVADIDSLPGLIGLAQTGLATILPVFLFQKEIERGQLVAINIVRPEIEWTVQLASRLDARRPRATLATSRLLKVVCAGMVEKGRWPGEIAVRGKL